MRDEAGTGRTEWPSCPAMALSLGRQMEMGMQVQWTCSTVRCKIGDAVPVTEFILGGSQRQHERASKHLELEFSLSRIAGTGMGDFGLGLRRVALLSGAGLL